MIYIAVLLLLLALLFCARKSYAWIIAAALVIASGSRLADIFDFSSDWIEFFVAQLAAAIMMVSGHLLCRSDSNAFRLFFRARLYGTSDFSRLELVKLLGFAALARRTVLSVSVVICLITAGAVMVVEFIESDSSSVSSQLSLLDEVPPPGYGTLDTSGNGDFTGELTEDSAATADFAPSANSPRSSLVRFPDVLLPVFLPLLTGLVIAQFFLRVQNFSWFSALASADLQREPAELPSYLWFFPALSVLLAWAGKFFAYLATF